MPDRPQIVIVNSTPIIALALISKLELLKHLYDKVLTPPAVQAEVLAGGIRGAGIEQFQQANWLQIQPLRDPRRADLL